MALRILLVVAVILAGCSGHSDPMAEASQPSASQPNPSPPSTPSAPTPSTTPQGDVTLASLNMSVGQFDQIFQPDQRIYSAKLGYLDNKVSIAATPSDPAASVLVNGAVVSGAGTAVELAEGANSVAVTVQNGSAQQTYSIDLERDPRRPDRARTDRQSGADPPQPARTPLSRRSVQPHPQPAGRHHPRRRRARGLWDMNACA